MTEIQKAEFKSGHRILIIEDDADMNRLLHEILVENGYSCISALDGTTGLEHLKKNRPDLVLLDYSLPDKNGSRVCNEINADTSTRGLPVIMISAHNNLSNRLSSFMSGVRRFITKPFSMEELLEEIAVQLASQPPAVKKLLLSEASVVQNKLY